MSNGWNFVVLSVCTGLNCSYNRIVNYKWVTATYHGSVTRLNLYLSNKKGKESFVVFKQLLLELFASGTMSLILQWIFILNILF